MSDKPLPPTDKRLRDARDGGNFARSEMLTGLAVSLLAIEVIFVWADAGIERWILLHNAALAQVGSHDRIETGLTLVGRYVGWMAAASGTVCAVAIAATILSAWVCGGLSFTPKAIGPSLKRLNAARHFKEIFGRRNLKTVMLAVATACVASTVAYWKLRAGLPVINAMIDWQSLTFDREGGIAAAHTVIRIVLAALLPPAVLSAVLAKQQLRHGQRMSHRELKDELKQTSGDPSVRARQRMSSNETVAAPPRHPATGGNSSNGKRALIVNPQHFAILLDDKGDTSAPPILVAKGTEDDTMQMTNSALLERVVVFRFRSLARYLYRHGELQLAIPPDCYRAVAIVYRIVEEMESLDDRPNVPIEIDDDAFSPQPARS
jgi:flagellar biosynthesis protein FlhB